VNATARGAASIDCACMRVHVRLTRGPGWPCSPGGAEHDSDTSTVHGKRTLAGCFSMGGITKLLALFVVAPKEITQTKSVQVASD